MRIDSGLHLTYCTNIHPGETWEEIFSTLKAHVPQIRGQEPFGIGLRLSGIAAKELASSPTHLDTFRAWLNKENCYVFTMNGFPYGQFHETVVKEDVHSPDWLDTRRVSYTKDMAFVLAALMEEPGEAGISTSPISYRHWHSDRKEVILKALPNILEVVLYLDSIYRESGKSIHLDIEPEPDGILENAAEFIEFYTHDLLVTGVAMLEEKGIQNAGEMIRRHVQLCFDVCHFSVEFESPGEVIDALKKENIPVGKIQISAALRSADPQARGYDSLEAFNESTYLHQAVGKIGTSLKKYNDLSPLLQERPVLDEVRCHFHVPIFTTEFGGLDSTQFDIVETLQRCKEAPFTNHLEIETYTWNVLPESLEMGLSDSIRREIDWVLETWKAL